MQNRVYITEDTFVALVAFLQKGVEKGMYFLVIDSQDIIKDRLWTFSSSAFIPNVKYGDALIKKHKIPIIISTKSDTQEIEGYTTVVFEPIVGVESPRTIFVKSKSQAKAVILNKGDYIGFGKINGKWQEVEL